MRPRIRKSNGSYDPDTREKRTEIGWPRFHVWRMSHFHTWKNEESRTDTETGFSLGPFQGFYITASTGTGCYPDTDEEGWAK